MCKSYMVSRSRPRECLLELRNIHYFRATMIHMLIISKQKNNMYVIFLPRTVLRHTLQVVIPSASRFCISSLLFQKFFDSSAPNCFPSCSFALHSFHMTFGHFRKPHLLFPCSPYSIHFLSLPHIVFPTVLVCPILSLQRTVW